MIISAGGAASGRREGGRAKTMVPAGTIISSHDLSSPLVCTCVRGWSTDRPTDRLPFVTSEGGGGGDATDEKLLPCLLPIRREVEGGRGRRKTFAPQQRTIAHMYVFIRLNFPSCLDCFYWLLHGGSIEVPQLRSVLPSFSSNIYTSPAVFVRRPAEVLSESPPRKLAVPSCPYTSLST